jgi:hypothetical protein
MPSIDLCRLNHRKDKQKDKQNDLQFKGIHAVPDFVWILSFFVLSIV